MHHAAEMHTDPSRDWSPDDWRAHIDEERRILFPALLDAGRGDPTVANVVAELEADHVVYLERLSAGLSLPEGRDSRSVDVHGAIEDGLVREYESALRSRAVGVGVGSLAFALSSAIISSGSPAPAKQTTASTWSFGRLALLGAFVAAGGWAYGWIGAGLIGLGGALALPRLGGATKHDETAEGVIASIRLTDPPPSAMKPSTVDMGALQAQFDQEVTNYFNERNAREQAFDDDMDTWAKYASAAGPEGYAMAKILAGAAKFVGSVVKSLQHNPDAKVYADDAKRLWVMIGQAGLAPPPYAPVSDLISIETYKSTLYDTIDKLRTSERGGPWQPIMLELGYWTKRTITDPRVAAWYSALATGGRIGKTAGEIRGEGPPDLPGQYHGVASVESVWGASSAALAGTVAAAVMGVPIAGPVNAAVANLESFTKRHPGAQHNETNEFNVAQIIATSEAWEAAKAQASKEAGAPFPSAGAIEPPWPRTGDI